MDDGGLKIRLATGDKLPVPAARIDRYGKVRGRKLTFGLRPEHLTEIHPDEKPGVVHVEADVDVIEPMGMETMVHFFTDGVPMCARIDPSVQTGPGDKLKLAANLNHMHLIDDETGRVI